MKTAAALAAIAAGFLLFAVGGNAASVNVPCGADLNAAYRAAQPGDVLILGACSYPSVTFSYDASKTSSDDVVIQGAGVGQTVLGDADSRGAKHLTLRNLSLRDIFWVPQNGSSGGQRSEDLTVENVDMYQGGIFLRSCLDCTFRNGASGNTTNAYSQTVGTYSGLAPSQNVLIENWRFHDMNRSTNPGGHMECLFIQESDGVTVRDSLFERCAIMDVFVSPIVSTSVPTNLRFERNTFRRPSPERGGGAFLVNPDPGSRIANYTFDGNVWDDRLYIENDGGATVENVVYCSSNTGAAPVLDAQTAGFIRKDCDGAPPPPPPAKQCADELDNDADGKVDLADPGCADAADDNEADDPPPPPPDGCDQACVDAYEARIADLQTQVAAEKARANGYRAILDQIHALSG